MFNARLAACTLTIAMTASLLAACSASSGYASGASPSQASCGRVHAAVVRQARANDRSGSIDRELQYLSDNCPDEYEIAADYLSSRATDPKFGFATCDEWAQHIRTEAVELLRADGSCVDGAGASASRGGQGHRGLPWNEAARHVGSSQRVCGPLASARTDDNDVFLNIGRDYPDPARFTIVLWDVGGVERLPTGTTLCASGMITSYNGVAQIQLKDVGSVEVWE